MNPIGFLLRRTFVNNFKELGHNPGKLLKVIFFAILIIMITVGVVISFVIPHESTQFTDVSYLGFGVFLYTGLITIVSLQSSMSSGATFFSMPDVNIMFNSPIKTKKILNYGMVKQLGQAAFASMFLIYMAPNAVNLFGLKVWQMVTILIAFILFIFMLQIFTMVLYSYTAASDTRKKVAKGVIYTVLGLFTVAIIIKAYTTRSFSEVVKFINSTLFEAVPVIGWFKGLLYAIITLNVTKLIVFAAVLCAFTAIILTMLYKSSTDFYEDVLDATEKKFALKETVRESGGMMNTSVQSAKIKVKSTGINGGHGASALFFRQLREMNRGGIWIFDTMTLVMATICVVYSFMFKNSENGVISALTSMLFVQIMLGMVGRWKQELKRPYVYMIPATSFKKLLAITAVPLIKCLADNVIAIAILAISFKMNILVALLIMVAFVCIDTVPIAINVFTNRFLGGSFKGVLTFLSFLFIAIWLAPGVVAFVLLFDVNIFIALAVGSLICLLVSALTLFVSRNLLDNCESI